MHIQRSLFAFDWYLHWSLAHQRNLPACQNCYKRCPFVWRTRSQPDRLNGGLCLCAWADRLVLSHPAIRLTAFPAASIQKHSPSPPHHSLYHFFLKLSGSKFNKVNFEFGLRSEYVNSRAHILWSPATNETKWPILPCKRAGSGCVAFCLDHASDVTKERHKSFDKGCNDAIFYTYCQKNISVIQL